MVAFVHMAAFQAVALVVVVDIALMVDTFPDLKEDIVVVIPLGHPLVVAGLVEGNTQVVTFKVRPEEGIKAAVPCLEGITTMVDSILVATWVAAWVAAWVTTVVGIVAAALASTTVVGTAVEDIGVVAT